MLKTTNVEWNQNIVQLGLKTIFSTASAFSLLLIFVYLDFSLTVVQVEYMFVVYGRVYGVL